MPAKIDGIAMAARNRAEEVYCVGYQKGSCGRPLVDQHSEAGKLLQAKGCDRGLHRCAALFCSGRTCHGDHPGSQCRQRRRLNERGVVLPTTSGGPHNGDAHARTAAADTSAAQNPESEAPNESSYRSQQERSPDPEDPWANWVPTTSSARSGAEHHERGGPANHISPNQTRKRALVLRKPAF